MFTGLIETVGTVAALHRSGAGGQLRIEVRWPDDETPKNGDSIAINGVCLTAIDPTATAFAADLSPETLDRTLLGALGAGSPVNLERALKLGDRLGGHIVQGHVDTVIRLMNIRPEGGFQRWRMELPRAHAGEVANKGSITLNGVSLTVAALDTDWFEVALIPATLDATVLGGMSSGSRLHLETDVLAKYVARQTGSKTASSIEEIFGGGGA